MVKARSSEDLKLNISMTYYTVAAVLVREDEKTEKPVYYISHTLKDAELRYPRVEKLIYVVVISSKKLRHYFQSQKIIVMTDQLLRRILH